MEERKKPKVKPNLQDSILYYILYSVRELFKNSTYLQRYLYLYIAYNLWLCPGRWCARVVTVFSFLCPFSPFCLFRQIPQNSGWPYVACEEGQQVFSTLILKSRSPTCLIHFQSNPLTCMGNHIYPLACAFLWGSKLTSRIEKRNFSM